MVAHVTRLPFAPAFLPLLGAACLLCRGCAVRIAADASPWDDDMRSGGAADCRARDRDQASACLSRGRRDQARARLEDLLALSRRLRRAAAVRFLRLRQRQGGDRAVAGADALCRRRRRAVDRLQGQRDPAAAHRAAGCRQAGHAAAEARLRGLREAVRAGEGGRPSLR